MPVRDDRGAPREGRTEIQVVADPGAGSSPYIAIPVRTRSRWVSGYRIVAPLFAACRRAGSIPAARTSSTVARKRSSCSSVVFSSSAELAKWVHSASRRSPAAITRSTNAGVASGGYTPARCIPVSTFTCTPTSRPAGRCRQSLERSVRVQAGREPGVERHGLGAGRELRQHQDRRLDPRVAQPEPFLDERDADPRGAGLERGARHRDVAVPVRVGLHHRHQLRARRASASARCGGSASRSTSTQVGRSRFTRPPTRGPRPPARGARRRRRASPPPSTCPRRCRRGRARRRPRTPRRRASPLGRAARR